jgi:protein-S-isoprenylcysteine O-methyltransferase Ste14
MIRQHIILVFLWIGFSVFHSVLAAEPWKKRMQLLLKDKYKFYRISYSVFALVTLSFVLLYHFNLQTISLWNVSLVEKIIAIVCMIFGGAIMLLYIRRFFFDLSGADVFRKKRVPQQLIKTNLYKYVRHPLYAATLVFAWSIFLWQPLLSNLISCLCITAYTLIGIHFEEKKLIREFGESYLQYRLQTPMLVPGLF